MIPGKRTDEDFMALALNQARAAAERGEVPVGALAVTEDRILSRAFNQVEMLGDATAHAEMVALTQAEAALGDWRLTDVTLYVTKEPCAMCAGAMVNCRLGRLVFGCPDPAAGAAGSVLTVTDGVLHKVPVAPGVLARECLEVLQAFFKERRRQKKDQRAKQ